MQALTCPPTQRACTPRLMLLDTTCHVKLFETHFFTCTVVITALCAIFLITLTFSNLTLNCIKICLRQVDKALHQPCSAARTFRMHTNRAVTAKLSLPRRSGYAHVHGGGLTTRLERTSVRSV